MKRCISDEIADALRGELEGGRYQAGECLPPPPEKREAGASVIAFRRAKRDKCAKTLEGTRKMKRRRGASPKVTSPKVIAF